MMPVPHVMSMRRPLNVQAQAGPVHVRPMEMVPVSAPDVRPIVEAAVAMVPDPGPVVQAMVMMQPRAVMAMMPEAVVMPMRPMVMAGVEVAG